MCGRPHVTRLMASAAACCYRLHSNFYLHTCMWKFFNYSLCFESYNMSEWGKRVHINIAIDRSFEQTKIKSKARAFEQGKKKRKRNILGCCCNKIHFWQLSCLFVLINEGMQIKWLLIYFQYWSAIGGSYSAHKLIAWNYARKFMIFAYNNLIVNRYRWMHN